MSLAEGKSQMHQFLAARYRADLGEYRVEASEKVPIIGVLANDLKSEAD